MNSSIKVLIFAFITFLTLKSFSQSTNKELFNRIDTYLESSVTNGFSGVVLVSEKGEIILSKGYGWAGWRMARSTYLVNMSAGLSLPSTLEMRIA